MNKRLTTYLITFFICTLCIGCTARVEKHNATIIPEETLEISSTLALENESTEAETETEKPTEAVTELNYIYEKITDDVEGVVAKGDIAVLETELNDITKLIEEYGKPVSFKAVSVDGKKCLSYNSELKYFPASAIKAPYLLYCYMQIDEGAGSLEETMAYTSKFYNPGTGDIKDSPEGTLYTMKEILRRVIWNSDNSGYGMAVSRFGKDGYNALITEAGATSLTLRDGSIWGHDTSTTDFVIAWKSIYDYFQKDTDNAKEFYDSCTHCKWNFFGSGIPNTTIAQKYGWTDEAFCNTAIVYGENTTYILSIYTDSAGEKADMAFMVNASRKIHTIMNKENYMHN